MLTVDQNAKAKSIDGLEIVNFLSNRCSYPEKTIGVERVETHISWVFLTDRFAYKLKKPVKFDFLDFSTPKHRRAACEEELRLNRRLARDTYLDVLPVTRSHNGTLQLDGRDTPVDWVVKMRRLAADHSLDRRILANDVVEVDVAQIACKLTQFYQQLPPLTILVEEFRRSIQSHVDDNNHELLQREHHFSPRLVQRLHHAQLRLLKLAPDLLDDRVRDGRVVDGHGDLRPEHIYLDDQLPIIDCLEFSAELRSLDVLDELAFLAMECEMLGAKWIGEKIIQHYQQATGDHAPDVVLTFYKLYRACVRAKVLSLRAAQLNDARATETLQQAHAYLQLAARFSDEIGPPLLLVVRGLPGSGKSTLARAVAESLDMTLLQTDAVRRDLFGESQVSVEFGQRQYAPESRARVYDKMFAEAAVLLEQGQSTVLDGTFLAASQRQRVVDLARQTGAEPLIVCCECPRDVSLARITERMVIGNSDSETRPEFYDQQQRLNENDPADLPVIHVDTTSSLPELQRNVFDRLRQCAAFSGLTSGDEHERSDR